MNFDDAVYVNKEICRQLSNKDKLCARNCSENLEHVYVNNMNFGVCVCVCLFLFVYVFVFKALLRGALSQQSAVILVCMAVDRYMCALYPRRYYLHSSKKVDLIKRGFQIYQSPLPLSLSLSKTCSFQTSYPRIWRAIPRIPCSVCMLSHNIHENKPVQHDTAYMDIL